MLMPKKVKWRKQQRGRRSGRTKGGEYLAFGDYGLQALERGLGHGAPDRGGPRRHLARGQARRQALDPRVPGQADYQEAARDPHG